MKHFGRLMAAQRPSYEYAHRMGFDAGFGAPNTTNCHFSLFATPELTKAWEVGKREGEAKRLMAKKGAG